MITALAIAAVLAWTPGPNDPVCEPGQSVQTDHCAQGQLPTETIGREYGPATIPDLAPVGNRADQWNHGVEHTTERVVNPGTHQRVRGPVGLGHQRGTTQVNTYGRCTHCGIVTSHVHDNKWNCGTHFGRFHRIEDPWSDKQRQANSQRLSEIYGAKWRGVA